MKLRAAIFDIYQTVLEVGPPPADREDRWQRLARTVPGVAPSMTIAAFTAACDRVIAREHSDARAQGIIYPEIFWPDVVTEVLPELASIPADAREDFLLKQQSLFHTVRLMPGAAAVLRWLRDQRVLIGVASNAQPYTLRELEHALCGNELSPAIFTRELCFWSFEHGFSKPDPHVFRLLSARLRARGVQSAETLMVGDRADNDINPARAHGWQTWQLGALSRSDIEGDWTKLGEFVRTHV
jgi:FMN phosphatase YigB (HAD superfamily)